VTYNQQHRQSEIQSVPFQHYHQHKNQPRNQIQVQQIQQNHQISHSRQIQHSHQYHKNTLQLQPHQQKIQQQRLKHVPAVPPKQMNMTPPVYVPGSESVHNVGSIPTDEDENDEEENEVLQTSLTGKKKKNRKSDIWNIEEE